MSFKTSFPHREKKCVILFFFFLNNNKKKNYRPLSRKKGRKCRCAFLSDGLRRRQASRWRWEMQNTHWRRAWELQRHPLTEAPWAHQRWVRLSPVLGVNPYSLSPADLALLFSSQWVLELTAAGDGLCVPCMRNVDKKRARKLKKKKQSNIWFQKPVKH